MKITNGKNIIEVTRGAFESIYEKLGFEPFIEETKGKRETDSSEPEMTDDEKFIAQVTVKPISQWTAKEMKRYADLKGIDAPAKDLREIIKAELEKND